MGSVSAMSATNRIAEVVGEKGLELLKKQFVGRKIVDVALDSESCYEVKLSLKLDNGEWIDGGNVAEYVEGGGDDVLDGCVIFSICPLELDQIRKEYKKRGWKEHL